ncbi:MAG: NTP transferase domain-containing protein [Pseudomonadota bacterium]
MAPLLAILGAGRAVRFGSDKLAQPVAGRPLALHALAAAHATGLPLIWIGGAYPPTYLPPEVEVLDNPVADRGLATSVALAARTAQARGHPALLIHLADMPCVSPALLSALAEQPGPAACRHPDGRPGVPAQLPARLFHDLIGLSGDHGAGALLAGLPDLTLLIPDHAELLDVDTSATLAETERFLS